MKNKVFLLAITVVTLQGCDRFRSPAHEPTPYTLEYPSHFPAPVIPASNPLTVEGVALGRHLFFDDRLSGDNSQSCNSCHLQESNFAEPTRFSTGIDATEGTVNAMTLTNVAWQQLYFWDGRVATLEDQVKDPIVNPIEMHANFSDIIEKLEQDQVYLDLFDAAYGSDDITEEGISKALAQYIRTIISGGSKFDQYVEGTYTFTASEQLGFDIFNNERGDCFHCHGAATTGYQLGAFGLLQFSNNGLDSTHTVGAGREGTTGLAADRGKFKIPSLRNIEFSFPYMHDGRFQTLTQVVDFYNSGGHPSPTLDPNMKAAGVGRNWSDAEKQGLLDFMATFSDPNFIEDTAFTSPW